MVKGSEPTIFQGLGLQVYHSSHTFRVLKLMQGLHHQQYNPTPPSIQIKLLSSGDDSLNPKPPTVGAITIHTILGGLLTTIIVY